MKRNGKRYKEEQIIYALRQVDGGRRIADVCREMGVAEQTYHRWKKKYAGMGVSELRRDRVWREIDLRRGAVAHINHVRQTKLELCDNLVARTPKTITRLNTLEQGVPHEPSSVCSA